MKLLRLALALVALVEFATCVVPSSSGVAPTPKGLLMGSDAPSHGRSLAAVPWTFTAITTWIYYIFAEVPSFGGAVLWHELSSLFYHAHRWYILGERPPPTPPSAPAPPSLPEPSAPPAAPPSAPPTAPPPFAPPLPPPPQPPFAPCGYSNGAVCQAPISVPSEMFTHKCHDSDVSGFGTTGFDAYKAACLNKPTVTIITTTNGNIMGAYSGSGYTYTGVLDRYTQPATAEPFLFIIKGRTYTNQKLTVKSSHYNRALYINPNYGPCFGGGHDFCISSPTSRVARGYARLGHTYNAPNGGYPYYFDSASTSSFTISRWEVFHAYHTPPLPPLPPPPPYGKGGGGKGGGV